MGSSAPPGGQKDDEVLFAYNAQEKTINLPKLTGPNWGGAGRGSNKKRRPQKPDSVRLKWTLISSKCYLCSTLLYS